MDEAAGAVDTQIVGGDTGSWTGPTAVSVTVIGRSAGVTPVTRGGARVGDFLHVTGPLGGSIVGRHLTFTPRLSLGRQLGAGRVATAMIDLSDGLSRDLSHVCRASGVGAIVETSRVPIHDDARQLPGDALGHALHDGEDYELLFTSPREQVDGATRIGRIVAGDAIELERVDGSRVPLVARAWQHVL
jgi:thiamine-monophosphate kinase